VVDLRLVNSGWPRSHIVLVLETICDVLGVLERSRSLTPRIPCHSVAVCLKVVVGRGAYIVLTSARLVLTLDAVIDCRSFLLAPITTIGHAFLK
jgi:hypothetical protein